MPETDWLSPRAKSEIGEILDRSEYGETTVFVFNTEEDPLKPTTYRDRLLEARRDLIRAGKIAMGCTGLLLGYFISAAMTAPEIELSTGHLLVGWTFRLASTTLGGILAGEVIPLGIEKIANIITRKSSE